jgi:O-antigen/teichoic acid export membrane protein
VVSDSLNRRRVLVMTDQGVSSLSNMLVGILVARALPADGFGAFGLAWVAYLLTVGVGRAFVGEPLLSRYSHEGSAERARHTPGMMGASLTISLVLAAVVAAVALALDGAPASAMLGLAAVLPFVLVVDAWRFVFIIDRPLAALAVDLVWLAGVVVAMTQAPAEAGPAWYVMAWGLTAAPAVLLAVVMAPLHLAAVRPFGWLRSERGTGSRFFGEFVTASAAGHLTLAGLGAVAGMGTLAAVRASQILFGPLNTVHAGIYLAVVPDGARLRGDPSRLRKLSLVATAIVVGVAVAWMLVCLVLPDTAGQELFGDSWADGSALVLPMGLAMIAGSAATGAFAGVRSLGDARVSLRARMASLPGEFFLPLGGAIVGGALGYTLGFLAARVLTSLVWWRAFVTHGEMAVKTGADDVAAVPVS